MILLFVLFFYHLRKHCVKIDVGFERMFLRRMEKKRETQTYKLKFRQIIGNRKNSRD